MLLSRRARLDARLRRMVVLRPASRIVLRLVRPCTVVATLVGCPLVAHGQPLTAGDRYVEWPRLVRGEVVEHVFYLQNPRTLTLHVTRIEVRPPLSLGRSSVRIRPGRNGIVRVRLDTSGVLDRFQGEVRVHTDNPAEPEVRLRVAASVVPPVKIEPMAALFITARRGTPQTASIDIVNHDDVPLQIVGVSHSTERVSTTLIPVKDGQRYRLNVVLEPDGPVGRFSDRIVIQTTNSRVAILQVELNVFVHGRLAVARDRVTFGSVSPPGCGDSEGGSEAITADVRFRADGIQPGQLTVRSDHPAIVARVVPDGDASILRVSLRVSGLLPGRFEVAIHLGLPDGTESITIPVSAEIRPCRPGY